MLEQNKMLQKSAGAPYRSTANSKDLFQTVEGMLRALPGQVSLTIFCPATGVRFAYHEDASMEAASVIKLPVMVEAFRQRREGILHFDQKICVRREDKLPSCGALSYMHDGLEVTVEDLVTLMIILSDNTATNLLIDLLGMDAIRQTMRDLKLSGTKLKRKLFQPELARRGIRNEVTARDMAWLLEKMLAGDLISSEASREMLNILKNQRLNGKIPFYLHDRGIPVAHKTGEDDGITHDVGIVFADAPIILCFLSSHTVPPQAERVLQEIAGMLV